MLLQGVITIGQPQLYQVLHRFELGTLKRSEPEVERLEPMYYTPFDEGLQWLAFDALYFDYRAGDRRMVFPNEIATMESLYHGTEPGCFITNGQGLEDHRNYISGERADQGDPGYMSLITGGNCIAGAEGIERGERVVWAETLAAGADVREILATRPWLLMRCTICTLAKLPSGRYKVIRFPHRNGADVLAPVVCDRPVYMPMSKLRKLPAGSPIPSPYVFE